jgi:hypothetical protein
MKKEVINALLKYGLDFVFVLLLLFIATAVMQLSANYYFLMLFFVMFIVSLLPITSYFHDIIDSRISPVFYEELFVQTVDSILTIESFDEVLKKTFDRVLELFKVRSGLLLFYYHDKDEFNIFYQRNRRSRIIRKARVENDNILFRVIRGPDDIIVRRELNTSIHFERKLIAEIERLNGELVIPIYYRDMFLGLIIIGSRKRRFSSREMRLLKVFASRIAILSVNSFFVSELLKKKAVEKEYEIASKIQKRFLPDADARIGHITVRVFHETTSLMTREFYDIFVSGDEVDEVRISAYRLLGNITGTSIYMPGIQALLQSFSRFGYPPAKAVMKLKKTIRERGIIDEEISLFHASVQQNGECTFSNSSYQSPFIFRSSSQSLRPVKERRRKVGRLKLRPGDILIIGCEIFHEIIVDNMRKYAELIAGQGPSPTRVRSSLIKSLAGKQGEHEGDRLLILIAVEGEK